MNTRGRQHCCHWAHYYNNWVIVVPVGAEHREFTEYLALARVFRWRRRMAVNKNVLETNWLDKESLVEGREWLMLSAWFSPSAEYFDCTVLAAWSGTKCLCCQAAWRPSSSESGIPRLRRLQESCYLSPFLEQRHCSPSASLGRLWIVNRQGDKTDKHLAAVAHTDFHGVQKFLTWEILKVNISKPLCSILIWK